MKQHKKLQLKEIIDDMMRQSKTLTQHEYDSRQKAQLLTALGFGLMTTSGFMISVSIGFMIGGACFVLSAMLFYSD